MDLCGYNAFVGLLDNLFPKRSSFDISSAEKIGEVRPSFDSQQTFIPVLIVPIPVIERGKEGSELLHPMVNSSTRIRYRDELKLARWRCRYPYQTDPFRGTG